MSTPSLKKLKMLLSRNWLPKFICLVLAIIVWCAIKYIYTAR